MKLEKLGRAILLPHIAVMIILLPISAVLLVGSMLYLETASPIAIASYVISAYTLTVWCIRLPRIIDFFRRFKNQNRYARRWLDDPRLRVRVSLLAALFCNALYGVFHLWLGLYHHTLWFFSLGAYYICLCAMRFFLARQTGGGGAAGGMRRELLIYRACGWVFLVMNLALSLIVFFMLYWGRTFEHHMIVVIAMAAYTFTAFTLAIINAVKYRKYNSPVLSASKTINLAAASVSMLTLTSTMLTAFGGEELLASERKMLLGSVGVAVIVTVVVLAIRMIIIGTRELNKIKQEVQNGKQ